jgi:hypothetical protein
MPDPLHAFLEQAVPEFVDRLLKGIKAGAYTPDQRQSLSALLRKMQRRLEDARRAVRRGVEPTVASLVAAEVERRLGRAPVSKSEAMRVRQAIYRAHPGVREAVVREQQEADDV